MALGLVVVLSLVLVGSCGAEAIWSRVCWGGRHRVDVLMSVHVAGGTTVRHW